MTRYRVMPHGWRWGVWDTVGPDAPFLLTAFWRRKVAVAWASECEAAQRGLDGASTRLLARYGYPREGAAG
jgi:hypothetical protein